jgi:hypothetical protein
MSTGLQYGSVGTPWPKILRYCKICQKETSHEIHSASGVTVTLCVRCLQDALGHELDRD